MAGSSMPPVPAKEDMQATWKYLEAGCNRVMFHLADGIDMGMYMNLYSVVHNYCTGSPPSRASSSSSISQAPRGAHLIGEELYSRLQQFLVRHLEDVYQRGKSHQYEALLTYYIKEWERYTLAAQNINHLFKYLNNHWVKREVDEGKKDVYDVYTLHLVMWKRDFFMKVHQDIMVAVLNLIEKQRVGETIDQSMIRSIVHSFVSLGMDEAIYTKTTLDVYKFHFAKPFLDATAEFYRNESTQFLADNTVVEYMKKAEARLDEEKQRVDMYLNPDTQGDLMRTALKALVEDHAVILRDEFQRLLDADKQEDLARMYRLLNRVTRGLDPLRVRFEDHVRKAGEASVSTAAASTFSVEPKTYVDSLLAVYIRYEKLVKDAFNGEAEFVRSLDNACKEFVNHNKICQHNSSKSPELLSKYTDTLLKRGKEDEGDMEELQKRLMTIFRFIDDKDVFYKFYQRALAKRLIHSTSVSDEAEVGMIGKLKEVCGFEYTNKLQRMFQDIQTSKDLNRDYQNHLAQSQEDGSSKDLVDATYSILGTSFWPLPPSTTNFTPPPEIIKTYQRFKTYYDNKHTGRKLTWQWNLCKGEVKSTFLKGLKTQHIFQVSTYQMAVLCMFNESDTVRYDDMLSSTQLDKEILDQSMGIMVKAKLLLPNPPNGKMESGTVYSVNENFKYKKVKVNFQTSIKTEQKAEENETHKTIEEDRKLLLQSAIVRIMKSRKSMKHTMLVQETIGQVRSRFKPQIPDIKKAIDQLIDKEYLERYEDDLLGYLA